MTAISPSTPIISVKNLIREFAAGEQTLRVLDDISFEIFAGEMVAIIGQSGSGKSTLMNILGCLDKPTAGSYEVFGQATASLEPNQLARLRREHFGFIFQRYHLLGDLTATDNVTVPAVYAGVSPAARKARAQKLLTDLGLADRLYNRPSQLSGGQQQRVSIARALMNGGDIVFADEPTGALDSQSGDDVMAILRRLNAQGHTIIMVTHDPEVAAQAGRIIEIKDGRIIADSGSKSNSKNLSNGALNARAQSAKNTLNNALKNAEQDSHFQDDFLENEFSQHGSAQGSLQPENQQNIPSHFPTTYKLTSQTPNQDVSQVKKSGILSFFDRLTSSFKMALLAMKAHRMRTFLTMLGIIIGIASVVTVVAIGKGSKDKILADISAMGTNTITVRDGYPWGDPRRRRGEDNLKPSDAQAVALQPYVQSVSPQLDSNAKARYKSIEADASIAGVGQDYLDVTGETLAQGQGFDAQSIQLMTQDAILDQAALNTFFPVAMNISPIGEVILVGKVPMRIIGVLAPKDSMFSMGDSPTIYIPYTTMMSRIQGTAHIERFVVRLKEGVSSSAAESAIAELITQRHGKDDFRLMSSDQIKKTVESTTATMTLLISSIAIISLIVGGIGVMNIMLVSVTERTSEIGVRMAVGARQSDILSQFLIEAVLVCLLGGLLGVLLSLGAGMLISHFAGSTLTVVFSTASIIAAFICSTLIGVVFGFLPAKNAARLDPVEALARE